MAAALTCPAVRDVVVVTDDALASRELAALGAGIVPDEPRGGLNAALAHGATVAGAARRAACVAALNADLPALRPPELARVLDAAAAFPRAFPRRRRRARHDAAGRERGRELRPFFGPGSRARHRESGAVELGLDGVDSVRQDVDTGDDLRAALALGVGPHTAAVAARSLITEQ
ncbi:2-phospho-L-lactate guanylyltransferase [Streptomyces heliomycini]